MEETLHRIVENLFGRIDGPMHFRIFMQPLMAVVFAVLGGIKDAKTGRLPYNWAILTHPEQRRELLKSGWKDVGKIFILAILLDTFYQLKVLHRLYPAELIITAFFLAIVPYMLLRGPVNRVVSFFKKSK